MTVNRQPFNLLLTSLCFFIALYFAIDRGGVIAWVTLVASVGLLFKLWRKPGTRDFIWNIALAAVPVLLAYGAFKYVIHTWESGEVVELAIETSEGMHHARVWVMDIDGSEVVYYDAPPLAAAALLSGKTVSYNRASQTAKRNPLAQTIDKLDDAEAARILAAMEEKYSAQNHAAAIWYGLLGRPKDRVALIVRLLSAD